MNLTSRSDKGFTLIELMVTIAIVVIVSVIAVPVMSRYISRTKVADVLVSAQALKDLVNNRISDKETVTGSGADLNLPDSLGRNVTDFNVSDDGAIEIETSEGINLVLTPSYDQSTEKVTWTCIVDDADMNDNVPVECRR